MITVFTFGYNEEYLIPYFLNHYSYADRIIYYDNQSTDNSINLLKSNKIEIRQWNTNNQQDNDSLRLLKNNCWKGTNGWIIVCDIDEFLIGLPPDHNDAVVYQCEGWQAVGKDGQDLNDIKLFYRDKWFDKCLLFNSKIGEINYFHGAHRCEPTSPIITGKYKLNHYSFLGESYLINRWKKWKDRMCEKDIKKGWGFQYLEDAKLHYKDACSKCNTAEL